MPRRCTENRNAGVGRCFFKERFQDAPSGLIKSVEGRSVTHVVGGLLIATTIPSRILFVSARARGRLHAQDGRDRARAENKSWVRGRVGFYKQVTRYAGLY